MTDKFSNRAKDEAIEWALAHGMAMKTTLDSAQHPAFVLTPTAITPERFQTLAHTVSLLGKLIHAVSEDAAFIEQAIEPITTGDSFFQQLLHMHCTLQQKGQTARRLPMLIMRSDFMDDVTQGPKLVEFNGIAAGMGPFGQRTHELHRYLSHQWPSQFDHWSGEQIGPLVENRAIENLAKGIAKATWQIKHEFADKGPATFLMVIQEHEDNVFDQHLLEHALQDQGIRTVRRSFRELYDGLSAGEDHRLLLDGIGSIDCVYLRAGYQYSDYIANDIIDRACCQALTQTRLMIEQHRVAVNATVAQQLATSKRVQLLLSLKSAHALTRFNLTLEQAERVKALMGEMRAVDKQSIPWIAQRPENEWVLKNQGEGGGHCVFGQDIVPTLQRLDPAEYQVWSLMRRWHPACRQNTAYVVRKGEIHPVEDLISEIGMFTVHIDGQAAFSENAYAGYLIRSKSSQITEGGVHSGLGALDSLAYSKP
ncbi:glutathione synthase [Vibrio sp. SM6]|uniref:glutathione synthase n=2 Tax=Vibrio agarilyticus TaxID=2726741 RepID=A0A7X8TPZ9_9VIBR|nr:glutathione synthase [Vibrio agarilyticus]NLS12681.1 glutathione synthase [Vibrio agarilyticus]